MSENDSVNMFLDCIERTLNCHENEESDDEDPGILVKNAIEESSKAPEKTSVKQALTIENQANQS